MTRWTCRAGSVVVHVDARTWHAGRRLGATQLRAAGVDCCEQDVTCFDARSAVAMVAAALGVRVP